MDTCIFPSDWSTRTLGEIGQCLIGLTYEPENVRSDGILVLRSSNIEDGNLRFTDNVFVSMDVPERIIVRENDLLICVRNGSRSLIGKCALVDRRSAGMTFGAFMSIFRSPDNGFVFYCFQSDHLKRQIHGHLGATINQITNGSLSSFQIPYPRKQERDAITETLADVGGLLAALGALIAKKRAIRQAAMQQLLTGKTRLPGFNGEWETKRIGDICTFPPTANNPRSDLDLSGDMEYIHYGDIHVHPRPVLDCTHDALPHIEGNRVGHAAKLMDGDLVMVDASEDMVGVGKSIEVRGATGRSIVAGLHTIVCRGGPGHWAMGFKAYLQFIPAFKSALARAATGISVYAVSKRQLADVDLSLPPVLEQEAIATVLLDMDAEIEALELRRDKVRAVKQGMMEQLLTGRVRLV